MADFDVRIHGAKEVEAALGKMAFAVTPRGMGTVLNEIGLVLKRRAIHSFTNQEAPDETGDTESAGSRWKPLAPSTEHARREGPRRGRSNKILQDRGAAGLLGSISKDVLGASVAVGTALQYGLYHQFGTKPYTIVPKRAGGKLVFMGPSGALIFADKVNHPGLPSRSFLGYNKSDIEGMLKLIIWHLNKAAG